MSAMQTVVAQVNQSVVRNLKVMPMFQKTRFRAPGRLLTAKEFAAKQAAANAVQARIRGAAKSLEIAAFLAEEISGMAVIAQSMMESDRTKQFFASKRAIRNHSRGGR